MKDNSLGDADFYDVNEYAGVGKRLLSMLIDTLVLLLVGAGIWMPIAAMYMNGWIDRDPNEFFWPAYLVAIWLYLAPMKRSEFGTIGFRLLGVRLVSAKGGRPSLLNMSFRMVMWVFGPFNFFLDLLWLGADTENQSLRDCYLGTYLIKRNARPVGRGPLCLARYNAMGFALAYPRVARPRKTL